MEATNSETLLPMTPISSLLEAAISIVKSPSDIDAMLLEICPRGAITLLTTKRISKIMRTIAIPPTINRRVPICETDLRMILVGMYDTSTQSVPGISLKATMLSAISLLVRSPLTMDLAAPARRGFEFDSARVVPIMVLSLCARIL